MKEKRTLCELKDKGLLQEDPHAYKKLVRKGKFFCRHCGRVARKKRNLCKPKAL